MHNLTYIMENFVTWSTQGYTTILGMGAFWAAMFCAITGYIYLKNQSVVAWAVVMLVFIVAFGNALIGIDLFTTFIHILIALAFTGLLLLFVSKYRR